MVGLVIFAFINILIFTQIILWPRPAFIIENSSITPAFKAHCLWRKISRKWTSVDFWS